ncbi:hypothetical protein FOCC_FOCC013923 [Frankliniella occidentalis]|nr:hypothetical protein FOCC_FOCC013923 [Frankliniella occidentalis]
MKTYVPWPNTGRPWARIHIDFFQYKNFKFLIVNDPFSKWIEVSLPRSQTEAKDVILLLKIMFATFGPPLAVVSDNGPPFQSVEFANFCAEKNIVLLHSPKYHAPSNGSAEKGVDTAKKVLKKLIDDNATKTDIVLAVLTFLETYRNTPSTVTGLTPAELVFSFKPRTGLNSLNPRNSDLTKVNVPAFVVGERVRYRSKKGDKVYEGIVEKVLGKTTYYVRTDDAVHLVSFNQLNRCVPIIAQGEKQVPNNSSDPDYKAHYEQLLLLQYKNAPKYNQPVIPNPSPTRNVNPESLSVPISVQSPAVDPAVTPSEENLRVPDENNNGLTTPASDLSVPRRSSRVVRPPKFITENYVNLCGKVDVYPCTCE